MTETTDVFTEEKRSEVMSLIRGKDTKPEKVVRSYLHRAGFRFRLHKRDLPGKPDLWLRKHNAAIFVQGCYWHQHHACREANIPKKNRAFWKPKLEANVARDKRNIEELRKKGVRVLVIWECELDTVKECEKSLPKVAGWLESRSKFREIPPHGRPRRRKAA